MGIHTLGLPHQSASKRRVGIVVAFALTFAVSQFAQAQTYTVIHNFTGEDGADPLAGLTIDRGGKLYGTTYAVVLAMERCIVGPQWFQLELKFVV